jgi:hypothetical protein
MTEAQRGRAIDGPVTDEEPHFLAEVPHDNLVGALVALAAEVYILRERLQALEAELADRNVVPAGAVESREGTAAEQQRRQADAAAFTDRVLSELSRDRVPTSSIDPRVASYLQPLE